MFAFVGLRAENLDSLINASGWEDFGDYKAQKLKIGEITHRQISKDGKTLFTADSNKYFRLWDMETGKLLKSIYVEHQLPVFLMNDTLILYKNVYNYNNNPYSIRDTILYGYSLTNNQNYIYLIHRFSTSYDTKSQDYLNLCNFNMINDSIISIPYIKNNTGTSDLDYRVAGITYNINTKKPIELIKDPTFTNLHYFNDNKFIYESFYWKKDLRYGDPESALQYFSFHNDTVKKQFITSSVDFNKYSSSTISSKFDRYYFAEHGNLLTFNLAKGIFVEKFKIFDTFTNIILKNDSLIFSMDAVGKNIIAFNVNSKTYIKKSINNSQNQFCKVLFNSDSSSLIITSNLGKIIYHNNSFLDSLYTKFQAPKGEIIMEKEVQFQNLSSLGFDSFIWNFGDGSKGSSEVHARHLFKKAGKFNVDLMALKGGLYLSYRDSVIVQPSYFPNFEIDKSYGISPLTVKFKNYSDFEADSITWVINNGKKIYKNIESFEHTFDSVGVNIVTMTVYKAEESFNTTRYINVHKDKEIVFYSYPVSIGIDWYSMGQYGRTRFEKMAISADNKWFFYTTGSTSSNAGTYYDFVLSHVLNGKYALKNKFFDLKNDYSTFNSGIGNKILMNRKDSVFVFNYAGEKLFTSYNPDSLIFTPFFNKILIGANNRIITFNNKYLEKYKEFDLLEISGFDAIKTFKLVYNSNRFAENQNFYIFIKSINNDIWCGEFDENGFKEKKFSIPYLNFSEIYLTNKNEFYLIDAASKLTVLDLHGKTLYQNNNFNFQNYIPYKDDILVKFDYSKNDYNSHPVFKFVNKVGELIYEGIDKSYKPKSEPSSFKAFKLYDDSFILLITFDGYTFMNYEFYGLPEQIPDAVPNQANPQTLTPNPATDFIYINQVGIKNLKIYDLNGIELDCNAEYFENMVRVNTFELQTGIYFVRYEINGKIYFEKFVKI